MNRYINTLAIIGVGLIGGSLSLSLKSKGAVGRVIGVGRSKANLDEALRLGI
ncbi:MAG TPA: prephenate dehydrogenase/arogenate dehydrogenase family protein, partial [Casimicrobium sp.]|nr:prephenate dehydrogenase/arogenate dehydrogenase family protein [Casimicrobium sp.]